MMLLADLRIHNPKVGSSILPPATNLLLSFQSLTKQRLIAVNAAISHFSRDFAEDFDDS
jgi:hypothetical protein